MGEEKCSSQHLTALGTERCAALFFFGTTRGTVASTLTSVITMSAIGSDCGGVDLSSFRAGIVTGASALGVMIDPGQLTVAIGGCNVARRLERDDALDGEFLENAEAAHRPGADVRRLARQLDTTVTLEVDLTISQLSASDAYTVMPCTAVSSV